MPTSVMPKGVEHTRRTGFVSPFGPVPTSVMPKGVEHCSPSIMVVHWTYGCRPL